MCYDPVERHTLTVVEASNGFYLYLDGDEDCMGMGDGVGEIFDGLTVGEEGFAEAWQRHVDENKEEYLDAHFPYVFVDEGCGFMDLLEE